MWFLHYKIPCPSCNHSKKLKSNETFLNQVAELYGDEYTVLDIYKNADTRLHIKHNTCGSINFVLPHRFLRGDRCRNCFGKNIPRELEELKKEIEILTNKKISLIADEYKGRKSKNII